MSTTLSLAEHPRLTFILPRPQHFALDDVAVHRLLVRRHSICGAEEGSLFAHTVFTLYDNDPGLWDGSGCLSIHTPLPKNESLSCTLLSRHAVGFFHNFRY
jgi:hypothetical protein